MVPEGVPLLTSTPFTQPLPVAILSAGVPSPSPILQEGEEEEEEQEDKGFMDLTEFADEFEVFNQPSSPRTYQTRWVSKENPKEVYKNC